MEELAPLRCARITGWMSESPFGPGSGESLVVSFVLFPVLLFRRFFPLFEVEKSFHRSGAPHGFAEDHYVRSEILATYISKSPAAVVDHPGL